MKKLLFLALLATYANLFGGNEGTHYNGAITIDDRGSVKLKDNTDFTPLFYDNQKEKFNQITDLDDKLYKIDRLQQSFEKSGPKEEQKNVYQNFEDEEKEHINKSLGYLLGYFGNYKATQMVLGEAAHKVTNAKNILAQYGFSYPAEQGGPEEILNKTIKTTKYSLFGNLLGAGLGVTLFFFDPISKYFPAFEKIRTYVAGGLIGLGGLNSIFSYNKYQNEYDAAKTLNRIGASSAFNKKTQKWEYLDPQDKITYLQNFIENNKPKESQ